MTTDRAWRTTLEYETILDYTNTRLYYVMLHYAQLYYSVLYYTLRCDTILYYTIL